MRKNNVSNFSVDLSFLKLASLDVLFLLKKDLEGILKKLWNYEVLNILYGVQFKVNFPEGSLRINIYSSGRINFQARFDIEKYVFDFIDGQKYKKGKTEDVFFTFLVEFYYVIGKYIKKIIQEVYVIGADEAGKSERKGAIVIGMVGCEKKVLPLLVLAGVSDSKRASRLRLARLKKIIKTLCKTKLFYITPSELTQKWLKGNLNILLEEGYIELLKRFLNEIPSDFRQRRLGIYIDQFSSILNRFKANIVRALNDLKIKDFNLVIRHKAEIFPHVAAASVLAKVSYEKTKDDFDEIKPW